MRGAAEAGRRAMVVYDFSGRTALVTCATLVVDGGYSVSA